MSKTVNYDFSIGNFVTVEAPYGVNPQTLLDQVDQAEIGVPFSLKILRNKSELTLSIKPAALPA